MAIYALGDAEPTIDSTAFIHPEAVIIGDVIVGAESSIWPCAVLRGDHGSITIGDRTSVQDGSVIHTVDFAPTVVGDDCVIGHIVHLEGCVIESRSLVGNGAVVLHHAIIRSGALVGSNAVVTGGTEVPPGAMALGIPAKIRENCVDSESIALAAASYRERAISYPKLLRRIG